MPLSICLLNYLFYCFISCCMLTQYLSYLLAQDFFISGDVILVALARYFRIILLINWMLNRFLVLFSLLLQKQQHIKLANSLPITEQWKLQSNLRKINTQKEISCEIRKCRVRKFIILMGNFKYNSEASMSNFLSPSSNIPRENEHIMGTHFVNKIWFV